MNVRTIFRAGVRDCWIQRMSAIVMIAYLVVMFFYLAFQPVDYLRWQTIFSEGWVKIFTLVFILSICLHAWIGVWTIITDYIKPFILRLVCILLTIAALVSYMLWSMQIIWRI